MAGIDSHTLLLLHGESIEDSSPYHVPLTNKGVTVSSTQSRFGGKSLNFDGKSCISFSSTLVKNADSFTIDWWAWSENSGDGTFILAYSDRNTFPLVAFRENQLLVSWSGVNWDKFANLTPGPSNQWAHHAIVKNESELVYYKNGKAIARSELGQIVGKTGDVVIGAGGKKAKPYNGYIDEFRVSNIARWTSDFTPPSQPYGLDTPDTPLNFMATQNEESVTLSWESSEKATGYRLRKNGSVVYDGNALTFSDTLEPYVSYQYTLVAYNEHGESAPAILDVVYKPNPLLVMVTDRTQNDVLDGNAKGIYNASDLNRVSYAVEYVAEKLVSAGYGVKVNPKTDWENVDWMNVSQATSYLNDLTELRRQYAMLPATPNVPKSMQNLTYQKANDIEKILLDVYDQYLTMLTTYVACGLATCGGDYL